MSRKKTMSVCSCVSTCRASHVASVGCPLANRSAVLRVRSTQKDKALPLHFLEPILDYNCGTCPAFEPPTTTTIRRPPDLRDHAHVEQEKLLAGCRRRRFVTIRKTAYIIENDVDGVRTKREMLSEKMVSSV